MEKNFSRIHWIDISKGLGIFLVVLGHTYRANDVRVWLYTFHMPLFFILSGILAYKNISRHKSFYIELATLFWGLIWPFVLFLSINFLYWFTVEKYFRSFDIGPLWFLVALFLAQVVFLVCKRIFKERMWMYLILLCIVFMTILITRPYFTSNSVSLWYQRSLMAIFWLLIGVNMGLATQFKVLKSIDWNSKKMSWLAGILIVTTIIFRNLNGWIDMNSAEYGNMLLYAGMGIIGSLMIISLSMRIKINGILEFLGRYAIIILCTHEQLKRIIIKVTSILLDSQTDHVRNNILIGFIIAIVVIFLEICIVKILYMVKGLNMIPNKVLGFIK